MWSGQFQNSAALPAEAPAPGDLTGKTQVGPATPQQSRTEPQALEPNPRHNDWTWDQCMLPVGTAALLLAVHCKRSACWPGRRGQLQWQQGQPLSCAPPQTAGPPCLLAPAAMKVDNEGKIIHATTCTVLFKRCTAFGTARQVASVCCHVALLSYQACC